MSQANDWIEGWLKAQQGYWRAWEDMARQAAGGKTPQDAHRQRLGEGLEQWWKTVSALAPTDGRAVFDKLMQASQGYFALAERMLAGGGNEVPAAEALEKWLDGLRKTWAEWSTAGATGFSAPWMARPGQGDRPMQGMATFWDLPMDTWNRMVATVMPIPGDFTQALHGGGEHPLRDQANRFLSMPTVGYTREAQEQAQQLARRQLDYFAASQAYQAAFGKLGLQSVDAFQRALRARDGDPLTSLRELYDLWVEISEAAYADFVMTEEYQALYGRLVNSLLALKQQLALMVDQSLEAMHMPTHAEITTLQSRQQALRRDNQRMIHEINCLKKEVNLLHQQIAALQAGAGVPEQAVRKATPTRARTRAQPAASTSAKADAAPRRDSGKTRKS